MLRNKNNINKGNYRIIPLREYNLFRYNKCAILNAPIFFMNNK